MAGEVKMGSEPAFPCAVERFDGPERTIERFTGLTKREIAAIAAMQGLLANPTVITFPMSDDKENSRRDWVSTFSKLQADALLAELSKKPTEGEK